MKSVLHIGLVVLLAIAGPLIAGDPVAESWIDRVKRAETSIAAVLTPVSTWTRFSLPPDQPVLRLLVNASLPPSSVEVTPAEHVFSVMIEVADGQGKILRELEISGETKVTYRLRASSAEPVAGSFYQDRELVPTDTSIFYVALDGLTRPAVLQVKAGKLPAPLQDLAVRVYHQETAGDESPRNRWRRLSPARKQALARSNVFGPELLTEEEKINLLGNLWTPIPPSGLAGRDYTRRTLYTDRDADDAPVLPPSAPQGFFIRPGLRGVVEVPEPGGSTLLTFTPRSTPETPRTSHPIRVRIHRDAFTPIASADVPVQSVRFTHEATLPAGILELEADSCYYIEGVFRGSAGPVPIIHPVQPVRSYLTRAGSPVSFPIHHPEDGDVPIRVNLRALHEDPFAPLLPSLLHFEFQDSEGRPIHRGQLPVDAAPSFHDRLVDPGSAARLGKVSSSVFLAPRAASRLALHAVSGPVLVSVFNRPATLERVVVLPEVPGNRPEQPDWYPMTAREHEALGRQQRVVPIVVQTPPTEPDPDLIAGRYRVMSLVPTDPWTGRYILTRREDSATERVESATSIFREFPPCREQRIQLDCGIGRRRIQPALLFVQEEAGPLLLRVSIDGAPAMDGRFAGPTGGGLLPFLPPGERRLQIDTDRTCRLFLNQIKDIGTPSHLRRLVIELTSKPLRFRVTRAGAGRELISGRLFQPPGGSGKAELEVRIEKGATTTGPHLRWTYPRTRLLMAAVPGPPAPILGGNSSVDQGRTFIIPLEDDLAAGDHDLFLKLSRPGYLILSRIVPGAYSWERTFLEPAGEVRDVTH